MQTRAFVLLAQLGCLLLLLCAWQVASGWLVDDLLISRPSDIGVRFLALWRSGVLQGAVVATVEVVVLGLLFGSLAGYGAGLLAGFSDRVRYLVLPWVDMVFAIPKIALIPLFILWFGIGVYERSVFTAVVVFFFIFYAVLDGIRTLPQDLSRVFLLLNSSPWKRIVSLYVPATLGWTVAGLRIAMPYAFVSAISAEVINARTGLGALVRTSGSMLDTPGMFVGIVAAMLCAAAATSLLTVIDQRYVARFRPSK